jgi:hypothetical protein
MSLKERSLSQIDKGGGPNMLFDHCGLPGYRETRARQSAGVRPESRRTSPKVGGFSFAVLPRVEGDTEIRYPGRIMLAFPGVGHKADALSTDADAGFQRLDLGRVRSC